MSGNDKPRTPNNEIPITVALISVDRKLYRDLYCIECGHPFMATTDKFISIIDSGVAVRRMARSETLIETRCGYHYCKQRYNVYVRTAL